MENPGAMQYLAGQGQQGGAFDPLVEYLKAIQYFGKEQKMAGVSLWDAAATLRGRGGQLAGQIEPQMAEPRLQDAVGSGMSGVRGSLRPEQMEQLIQLLMKRGMSREQAIGRIGEMR